MYYYIRGKLVHKDTAGAAVDVNGVAYYMNTTLNSLSRIGEIGDEATMYTYLHVREDIMELYGFADSEEKKMFMFLISVSGVGPKAALSVLSVLSPQKLAMAVASNDVKAITKAAGVGPKMAQRIVLELNDKIDIADITVSGGGETVASDNKNEAISALVALGYNINDAKNAVMKLDSSLSVEEIIKKALLSF